MGSSFHRRAPTTKIERLDMRGKVILINRKTNRAAIETESGGVTVFDTEDFLSHLDIITGDMETHGDVTLFNETKNERMRGRIEAYDCTLTNAEGLLK